MPLYRVSDTVTHYREWHVEADSEDHALALVSDGAADAFLVLDEEVDSTPYEVEEIEEDDEPKA